MASNSWKPVTLGDLVEITHGFAFKGEFFRDNPPGDILLTPGNFAIGGGFKPDKFKYYVGSVPEEFVLKENDLLVTMTDLSKAGDTLGYPAILPASPKGSRYLHNQRLGKVIILPHAPVRKDFLYYLFRIKPYQNEVLASAIGTTVKHTSPKRIKAFKFFLPPEEEQQAIAHILGTLDDKIELNQQMNRDLEAITRAIFKSWFMDFDPVRAKMEGYQPVGMNAETAALFPDSFEDSHLGEIPKGWKVSSIGELVRIFGGSTPSTKESAYWEGGTIHWATPKDLASLSSPVIIDTERRITEFGLQRISSGLLPKGTVLLSSRAPIGYLAIAEVPMAINQGFIALICDRELPNHYILQWVRANMAIIQGRANGTTFLEISKTNFRPIPVVIPTQDVLQQFTDQIEVIHRQIVNNIGQSHSLAAIRDALLPKLMSGEIRIKDAEKLVEAAA